MNLVYRFITRFPFFYNASVERAISGITKAVAELQRVADQKVVDVEYRSQQIADLQIANHQDEQELYRANSIARRLRDLVA
jgi:hypothetical protein